MIRNYAPVRGSQYNRQNRNLLSFNRKVMLLAGIFPPGSLSGSTTKKLLFILYIFVWYSLYVVLHLGQILAAYHFWDNMEVATFILLAVMGASMAQIEVIYARLFTSSVFKVIEFLEGYVNSKMEEMDLNEKHIQILEKAKVKAKRLNIVTILFSEIMVACWIVSPFTRKYIRDHNSEAVNVTIIQSEERWLDLCFIIWAPIDITVSPYYEITYVIQILMFITSITHWKSVETTIMTLIIYTAAHLEILETFLSDMKISLSVEGVNEGPAHLANNAGLFTTHHSLKQLGTTEPNQEIPSMDRLEKYGFKNEKQKLKDFIAGFVTYHEAIIELVRRVNRTFGPVLFVAFFFCQILACLSLFQMAVTEIDVTSVINLIVCLVVTIPHFIFCWYGDEVIEKSQSLGQIAFENSLIQDSKDFKHFILMVMKNSQRPLAFSALGFYRLSLEEFEKTMNAAYAYFNILKTLHGDK